MEVNTMRTLRKPIIIKSLIILVIFCLSVKYMDTQAQTPPDDRSVTVHLLNQQQRTGELLQQRIIQAVEGHRSSEAAHQGISEISTLSELYVNPISTTENWQYGTAAVPIPTGEHGTPDSYLYLARKSNGDWSVAMEFTPQFYEWVTLTPPEIMSD